ncbi:hypothetical protein ACFWIQ_34000 [Kitasatospora sp. NPDC127059]|uniref:hypothetical protein n=1 Tax=unclassified Kitasatospora TaxID=2633591 RepID=UPI003655CE96
MPLVDITAPAGSIAPDRLEGLQQQVADTVLRWMELPLTAFFRSATWVYVHEAPEKTSATGAAGTAPGFIVKVTALEDFLTPERTEQLSVELTRLIQSTATPATEAESTVWVIVQEVPEGYWSVNGGLTRRAKIDEFIAQGTATS